MAQLFCSLSLSLSLSLAVLNMRNWLDMKKNGQQMALNGKGIGSQLTSLTCCRVGRRLPSTLRSWLQSRLQGQLGNADAFGRWSWSSWFVGYGWFRLDKSTWKLAGQRYGSLAEWGVGAAGAAAGAAAADAAVDSLWPYLTLISLWMRSKRRRLASICVFLQLGRRRCFIWRPQWTVKMGLSTWKLHPASAISYTCKLTFKLAYKFAGRVHITSTWLRLIKRKLWARPVIGRQGAPPHRPNSWL